MNNKAIEKPKMPENLIKELGSKAGTIYNKETMKYIEDYAKYLSNKAEQDKSAKIDYNLFKSWANGFKSVGVYVQEASHSGLVIDNIKVKVVDHDEVEEDASPTIQDEGEQEVQYQQQDDQTEYEVEYEQEPEGEESL